MEKSTKYLYTEKEFNSSVVAIMIQVSFRRAVVDELVKKSREDAAAKRRIVTTIDPVLKIARREYPFMTDRELSEIAGSALRIMLHSPKNPYQLTL